MGAVKAIVQPEEITPIDLGDPKNLQSEFREYLAESNYQRARNILLLVMLFAAALLVYDYSSFREGLWNTSPQNKQLLMWHLILWGGTAVLLLIALLIKKKDAKLKRGFVFCAAFFVLCQPAFLSGGIPQLMQLQITGYFVAIYGICALFYIQPLCTFFLYLVSYPVFVFGVRNFHFDSPLVTISTTNGFIFVVVAWLVSAKLYEYHFRDYKQKKLLEKISQQRIVTLEESLNISQEVAFRLASIVESTDDGIIGMTLEGIVTYWNQGAERVYGYAEEEMVGKSIFILVPEDLASESKEIVDKALYGEKVTNYETRGVRKDGKIVEVSLTLSLIKDNSGRFLGLSCILRDIGDQKRMERELARLDRLNLIGELAASISHEVRNPMATVRGFMQLLKEKKGCADYSTYFDLMTEELDRANGILTEFLSISRTKTTEKTSNNINQIIKSLLPLLEASAVANDKKIQVELEELPNVMVDDKEIRQVILNLARNGLEAMEAGGILTIRTAFQEEQVVMEIEDQGCGMSPEVLEQLGTPFYTTKSNGTGIGLAICYGIIARHNARIDVESSSKGTIFRVCFTPSL